MAKRGSLLVESEPWIAYLRDEWDLALNIRPAETYAKGSHASAFWLCKNGHSFQQGIRERVARSFGCPLCSGKRTVEGVNDLFTAHPELEEDFDFSRNPRKIYASGSYEIVHWKGISEIGCQHPFEQAIHSRVKGLVGCGSCSAKRRSDLRTARLLDERGSILESHPLELELWDYDLNAVDPRELHSGSSIMAYWKCTDCDEGFEQMIYRRLRSPYSKPCCEARRRQSELQCHFREILNREFPQLSFRENDRRALNGYEIDFYSAELSVGIEINGGEGFYHCHKEEFLRGAAEARREIDKHRLCGERGIELLQLWESDGKEAMAIELREFLSTVDGSTSLN